MSADQGITSTKETDRSPDIPHLSDGVDLIGEYEHSGFKEPPSLVRRGDGQILQFPPLLYELLKAMDGRRDLDDLAVAVGHVVQRQLQADDVRFLIEEKLRPQGIVATADGTSPKLSRPDPFLAFRYRIGVISERASGRLGDIFRPLFLPPLLAAVVATLVVADWWLFVDHGIAQALRQTLYHPALFLPLLGAVVLSAAFHEIGHATACRYGGARPGRMGCGLYLAWPAFYTDISDAYRLNRRGRLRTDLGGVYFNVIIIVATTAIFLVTHNLEVLLLLVVIEHMEIVHQLLPVIRLDGYYVVSDLTGVPDLFARIGPVLRGLLFWKQADPKVTVLKGWVRAAVTMWVMVVVPLLILEMVIVLIHLPRILATAWDSAGKLVGGSGRAFDQGRVAIGISDAAQIVVLAIPITGLLLMVAQLLRKVAGWAWRSTRHRPVRRGAAIAVLAGLGALLAFSWIPGRNYQPIVPGERGTEGEGLHALFGVVGGPGPLYSRQAALHRAEQTRTPRPAPRLPPPPTVGQAPVAPSGGTGGIAGRPAPAVTVPASVPSTVPPLTTPRVTVPPVTVPPVTAPQVTLPPVTVPPVTAPQVTVPPATVPPVTTAQVTLPPVTRPSLP